MKRHERMRRETGEVLTYIWPKLYKWRGEGFRESNIEKILRTDDFPYFKNYVLLDSEKPMNHKQDKSKEINQAKVTVVICTAHRKKRRQEDEGNRKKAQTRN